jgi:mono/diheme cytochrome c family protein
VKLQLLPIVVGALVAAGAGCGRDAGPTGGAGGGASEVNDGRALFQKLCATCHGPDGRPPATMVARLAVRDLTAAEFRARVTPMLVEQQIRMGSKNKLMPSFADLLDDARITALAEFVASPAFVPPPAPK